MKIKRNKENVASVYEKMYKEFYASVQLKQTENELWGKSQDHKLK